MTTRQLTVDNTQVLLTMAKDYVNRTLILGELKFGICRIKKLKTLLHLVQEFRRILEQPLVEGMTGDDFLK